MRGYCLQEFNCRTVLGRERDGSITEMDIENLRFYLNYPEKLEIGNLPKNIKI